MPEVSEAELQTYRNAMALLQKVNANTDARRRMESALKIINPEIETEEDVANRLAAPHVERISKLEADLASERKAREDAAAAAAAAADEARVAKALSWLEQQDYTEEGRAAIKKIMQDESIPNVEAAAALFEKRNPRPVSVPGASYESDSWNLRGDPNDANLKELFTNEDRWADNEAAKALNDIRRQQAMASAA